METLKLIQKNGQQLFVKKRAINDREKNLESNINKLKNMLLK